MKAKSKIQNSIEINGKRYDAITGKPLSHGHRITDVVNRTKPAPVSVQHNSGRAVAAPPLPFTNPSTALPAGTLMDFKPRHSSRGHHATAQSRQAHTPQTSKTLMRHAVHKPAASLKRTHPAHGQLNATPGLTTAVVTPKLSAAVVPADRQKRAQLASKSSQIARFSQPVMTPGSVIAPAESQRTPQVAAAYAAAGPQPAAPRPLDIFERALQQATSHEQPPVLPARRKHVKALRSSRSLSFGAASLAVLALLIVAGYSGRTSLTLHLASHSAGFSARLPHYTPVGFSLGHVSYGSGYVAAHYRASGQQTFAVVERPSSWDSQSLRDNVVAASAGGYQTVASSGQIIYLYGHNAATWVSGGVWYQVTSDGALNNDQLTQLAGSL